MDIPSGNLAIENLIIRISLPRFADYDGGNRFIDSKRCFPTQLPDVGKGDVVMMTKAGSALAQRYRFNMLKIFLRIPRPEAIQLRARDCIRNQFLDPPSDVVCYEDEGQIWDSREDSEMLRALVL